MSRIEDNLKVINDRIANACAKSGRYVEEIKLVIVTKSATPEQIKEVVRLGYTELGENRVQNLKKVAEEVAEFVAEMPASKRKKINWHMIGHLQRNKVKQAMDTASLIHSVDTLRLAEEINSIAARTGNKAKILMEINAAEEVQKYGVPIGAAIHLAEQIETLPNVELCGLMAMGPLTENDEQIRLCFSRVRELFIEMRGERVVGKQFREISMGMSNDYHIAIEEGTTMLRIGSAIFN